MNNICCGLDDSSRTFFNYYYRFFSEWHEALPNKGLGNIEIILLYGYLSPKEIERWLDVERWIEKSPNSNFEEDCKQIGEIVSAAIVEHGINSIPIQSIIKLFCHLPNRTIKQQIKCSLTGTIMGIYWMKKVPSLVWSWYLMVGIKIDTILTSYN